MKWFRIKLRSTAYRGTMQYKTFEKKIKRPVPKRFVAF